MTPTPVLDERELGLFVKSEIDDYGLDPYEFRIYARIVRRAGRGDAWESIPNMAKACMMSESRVRLSLQLLEAAGLIESHERCGYSTVRRITPKAKWVDAERLQAIRAALTRTKSATPSKSDRGSQTHTPSKSDRGVVSVLQPPPLAKVTDEGIPIEGIPVMVLPPSVQAEKMGGKKENLVQATNPVRLVTSEQNQAELVADEQADLNHAKSAVAVANCLNHLSEQVACLIQNTFTQIITSLNTSLNSEPSCLPVTLVASPASNSPLPSKRTKGAKAKTAPSKGNKANSSSTEQSLLQPVLESPQRTQLLQQLSALLQEPLENLRLNNNLVSALDRHPDRIQDALEYFKQANATWKNKPGIGLFICAVNKGMKPSPTKPGGGWKEWADEAIRRRLMSYSQSGNGDITIHFANGVQRLWSEVRSLSWSEIEKLASGDRLEQYAA